MQNAPRTKTVIILYAAISSTGKILQALQLIVMSIGSLMSTVVRVSTVSTCIPFFVAFFFYTNTNNADYCEQN